ncbi:MAG: pantoate--beta-alanine ligase [Candidatus Omnitrophica bacterium]|nr:pantoate--beta-alanine ligase [Candidatus Omnitrophota bacterium]MBI3083876.1 pantoate--beta-alanine ligase [Candidatus Omnitrophota bacterium]
MTVIRSPRRMALVSQQLARQGKRVGLVPTMGALHEGHLSLIRRSASQNDAVIVTVFVNPLQFGPREDFARYPRNLARDVRLSRAAGADIVFAPSSRALYPSGFQTRIDVDRLSERWEGRSRPGHFRGVATVVTLLFQVTRPTNAYFGQKDYQQALIIQRLARDLQLSVKVHVLPTVREPDGVAMSSRNAYLTSAQREQAAVLPRALRAARARILAGERRARSILSRVRRLIRQATDARIDYAAIVDARTLEPQPRLHGRVAILLAVWIGRTRLIDNLLVDVP